MVTSLLMVHLPPLLVRPAAEPLYLQQPQQVAVLGAHLTGQATELSADAEDQLGVFKFAWLADGISIGINPSGDGSPSGEPCGKGAFTWFTASCHA